MINMSYCRMENTRKAFKECIDAVSNREHLSDRELNEFKGLVNDIMDFFTDEAIIDEEGCINEEVFNELLEELQNSDNEDS